MTDGQRVLAALAELPGGPELLAAGERRRDAALVGGAVRDLLLDAAPRELDVVLDGEVEPLARELAGDLGAEVAVHERFGTALVEWDRGRIDLARRRAERYPGPGALPEVRPGSAAEDLARRDFTVNAIALHLGGQDRGALQGAEHALADLAAHRLRVLHRRSFLDDPTRLLRLARYRARLGFEVEPGTAQLARAAVQTGALATVTPARIGAELRLALGEEDPAAALEAAGELGLLAALHPRLRFDGELARDALALLAPAAPAPTVQPVCAGGARPARERPPRPGLLALAVLIQSLAGEAAAPDEDRARALLDELEIPAGERDGALVAARAAPALAERLAGAHSASQLQRAVRDATLEAVALAGAWARRRPGHARAREQAARWLDGLHAVRLQIGGEDLLAAGVPEGPEVGRRLQAALAAKLDGSLDGRGREAELRAALEASV